MGWGKLTGGRPGPLGCRTRSCREGIRFWEGGGGQGKGSTDFFGGLRPHASHCRSSTELWAPLCKAMFARWGWGGGCGNRDSVSLCHNFDGGGEGDSLNPFLQSSFPRFLGSPSLHLLLPHLSHPYLSPCLLSPGGAFPISPPGPPRDRKRILGGTLVSMVLYIIY